MRERRMNIFSQAYCRRNCLLLSIVVFSFILYSSLRGGNFETYNPKLIQKLQNITQSLSINNRSRPFCGYLIRSPLDARLGTQMFAYASFYALLRKVKGTKEAFIHVSELPALDALFENLSVPQRTVEETWWWDKANFSRLNEHRGCCTYDNAGLSDLKCDGGNFIVDGYRCSFKYFVDVMDEIKLEFTFKKSIRQKCKNLLHESLANRGLSRDKCVTVGVHLRRGDFEVPEQFEVGHFPAREEYLHRAIRFYEIVNFGYDNDSSLAIGNGDCLAFLLFGNDYDWIKNATENVRLLYPSNTHLITIDYRKSKPAVDMCAISSCDHVAFSTGTFGWWAAFFSRGMVTYQSQYARPGSRHFKEYTTSDYFLPQWISL